MPTIDVDDDALRDEETPVRVTGVEPGATVEILARTDGWYESGCVSRTTYAADGEGVVDTAAQAPVDAADEGTTPMRWLWSMAPEGGAESPPEWGRDPVEITLEARVDGGTVATATTVRRPADPDIEAVRVGGGSADEAADAAATDAPVVGHYFEPAGDGPHPGVLLLHGSGGRPLRGVAALLASHGYAAFAVRYFGDPEGVPDALSEVPVEYVDAAATWLREREGVADGPLGLYGQSKGAEAALVAAARFDWTGGVVAVAPTASRWQALDRGADAETGSWTVDGEVLPFVPFRAAPGEDDGNVAFRDVYAGSPARVPDERLEAAAIPVERIGADLLLVSGGDDRMWPSAESAAEIAARVRERGDADVTHCTDEQAGHGVRPPYMPTAGTDAVGGMALGGTPAGNARLAADAWPRVLDSLSRGDATE